MAKIEDETTLVELMPFRHLAYVRETFADHFQQHAMTPTALDWPKYLVVAYTQTNDRKKIGVGRIFYVHCDSTDGVCLNPLSDDRGGRLVVPSSIAAAVESKPYDPGLIQRQRERFIKDRARWELLDGRKQEAKAAKARGKASPDAATEPKKPLWKRALGTVGLAR